MRSVRNSSRALWLCDCRFVAAYPGCPAVDTTADPAAVSRRWSSAVNSRLASLDCAYARAAE
jgi:hypothetical protein